MSEDFFCPIGCAGPAREEGRIGDYRLWSCPVCGLRFAPEAFGAQVSYEEVYESKEYWDAQVKPLEDGEDPLGLVEHPTYAPFFARVKAAPGARLLDVGCGVGRFGRAAQARGFAVTGIDVSGKAVAIGRRLVSFPLRQSRLEAEAAGADRYEVVTAFEVLEHLADPVAALAAMAGLLNSGGQLFATVPNWDCAAVQTAQRRDWLPPIHVQFFTAAALRRAGEMSGLLGLEAGVIRTDPFPGGILPRARWLVRRARRRPRLDLGLWLHGRRV